MILANGFPKHGNHALVKAMQLLGLPARVQHAHDLQADARVAFIKRDPRNGLLSWIRQQGYPQTPGMFIAHFRQFDMGADPTLEHPMAGSLPQVMQPFEHWLTDERAIVVSYEALTADDAEMRRLADWAGVPYIADAFNWLPGMTKTWCADHSDWRKVWTPEVQAVWAAEGGPELLARWGYQ